MAEFRIAKTSAAFFTDLIEKRAVIFELTMRDFKRQYLGSYLGFIWTFLQPLIFISVLYVVFSIGLRNAFESDEMPFGLYLVCGMVFWIFFSRNLSDTTEVIRAHSFLVKRSDFRLSILPLVKILSSLIPHIILICFALALAWVQGYGPTIYTIQLIYYVFAASVLLLGMGWFTSSTNIFVRDVAKIVAVFVQIGFWLTPIFWNISFVPEKYQWLVKLNPLYYLVSGYRESLVLGVPFWDKPGEMIYFWVVTFSILAIGTNVFRKLRPQFAEVI